MIYSFILKGHVVSKSHNSCLMPCKIQNGLSTTIWNVTRKFGTAQPPSPPAPPMPSPSNRVPLDLSFEDSRAAYKSKTNWEILRAMIVYQLCSVEKLVNNNKKVMDLMRKAVGDTIFKQMMKLTFYGHFVAGESEPAIKPLLNRMLQFGVRPILDYSAEEDLPNEQAKSLEKESFKGTKDHQKGTSFQYSDKFADRRYKVDSARTFFYTNEASCERNMEIFLRCLEASCINTGGAGITAVKVTALGRPQLLLQLSEVIMGTRKYVNGIMGGEGSLITRKLSKEEFESKIAQANIDDKEAVKAFLNGIVSDKTGIVHLFPWSGIIDDNYKMNPAFAVPDIKTGKMVPLTTQLSRNEEEMLRNMIRRLNTIVKAAEIMGCQIMVDAEQTYFQPAISRITVEFMRKYNKERPIVLNTHQCYLKDTINEISGDLEQAKRQGFCFGTKIVRGAYLIQERERAVELQYPDPTNPTYEDTSAMYHKAIDRCIQEYVMYSQKGTPDRMFVMIASHNEESVKYIIKKMMENNIPVENKAFCFGQLLGMCDFLTFPLGQAGYKVYKYVPYGPVLEVMPYMSRRVHENKAILAKVKKEKRLLRKELVRRLATGKIMYTPKV